MTTVTCPHCGYKQTLRDRTVQRIRRLGKKRLQCTKCNKWFYAILTQSKT